MLVALECYLKEDHAAVWKEWEARCRRITQALAEFPDVRTEVHVPEIANAVPHLRITWDETKRGVNVRTMVRKLREGSPSIEVAPVARRNCASASG